MSPDNRLLDARRTRRCSSRRSSCATGSRSSIANLEQQHETAALGMWVFLATEVMFFGTLFLGAGRLPLSSTPRRSRRPASKLNWIIGGINTMVLLVSSLMMVLAVHYAKLGQRKTAGHASWR